MTTDERAKAIAMLTEIYDENGAGCCLHILADDGNTEDGQAEWCADYAAKSGHAHCQATALFLATLSEDDRDEIYEAYDEYAVSTLALRTPSM